MKRKFAILSSLLALIGATGMLTSCGENTTASSVREYSYSTGIKASKITMDNYGGMDLSGMEIYRFNSTTFDVYSTNEYVLQTTVSFAYNTVEGVMGNMTSTFFGTFTVEAALEGDDNTEYTYTLSQPTRVISNTQIEWFSKALIDSADESTYPTNEDGSKNDATTQLTSMIGESYTSSVYVDRSTNTIIDTETKSVS